MAVFCSNILLILEKGPGYYFMSIVIVRIYFLKNMHKMPKNASLNQK